MRLSTGSAGNEYNSDEDDDEEEDEVGDGGGGAEGGEKEEEACMIVLALNGAGGGGVGGGEEAAAGAAGAPAEAALLSSWNPSSAANSVMTRAASFASGSAGGGGGGIGEVLVLRASSLAERTVWVERLNTTIEGLRGQNASSSFTRSFKGGLGGSGGIAASGGGGDLLSRGVLMEGNIRKKRAASARQTWDRRYAVLSANTLVYADKKAHLTSNDKSRHIDLSRFSLRVNVGEDGASQVLELYCPFERAYHLKADSDGLTLAWAEAIRSEQGRIARILVERHKIDAVATTRSAAAAVGGSTTPSSSTPAAAMSGGGGGRGGAAAGAPGSEQPLRENSFPPPLPSERWLRQQGLLKYGWVDQRVISDTTGSYDASGGGGAGGGGGGGDGGKGDGRWRRQWLVLREDGLLLFYRKAKDTQPVKVLFAHEFNATTASGVAAAAQPPTSPQNNDQPSSRQYAIQISPVAYSDETEILLLDPQVRSKQHTHIPLPHLHQHHLAMPTSHTLLSSLLPRRPK